MTIEMNNKDELVMKNWQVSQKDVETGQVFYTPNENHVPIVLSAYGMHYAVKGFWARATLILWLELERESIGTMIQATLTPAELMLMELGLSDDPELNQLLMQACQVH